jgi:hypothetical protein
MTILKKLLDFNLFVAASTEISLAGPAWSRQKLPQAAGHLAATAEDGKAFLLNGQAAICYGLQKVFDVPREASTGRNVPPWACLPGLPIRELSEPALSFPGPASLRARRKLTTRAAPL